MDNDKIIADIALQYGYNPEDLHSMDRWNALNRRIKKGEHGILCRTWKRKEDKETKETRFFLAKTYLFHLSQTEEVVNDK